MKIVRIIGGLGNQMFQWAFMRALEAKWPGETVKADLRFFKGYGLHNGFELRRVFGLDVPVASRGELCKVTVPVGSYRLGRVREEAGLLRRSEVLEWKCRDVAKAMADSQKGYFWGYWQDEKYFKAVAGKVRADFRFPAFTEEKNVELAHRLAEGPWCSVHVRRGDYLKHKMYRGLCEADYYRRAIEEIRRRVGKGVRFVVFSNDMGWVRENLGKELGDDTVMVDWNCGGDSYCDMQLMSMCRHNIIANSSFSWWGAWLNGYEDKVVIAPKVWLNGKGAFNPACDSWVKI